MTMNECCADPANLGVESASQVLVTRVCRLCGAHHYEVTVDPGPMIASLADLREA